MVVRKSSNDLIIKIHHCVVLSESMRVTGKTGITHENLPSFESAFLILFCCRILMGTLSLQH